MAKVLLLVASLAGILTSVQSDQNNRASTPSQTCTLDFTDALPVPPKCISKPQDEVAVSQCCSSIYSTFVGVLAKNTNNTDGQLFLSASDEKACNQTALSSNLTTAYCDVVPAFSADGGPCLFETVSQLEANLNNTAVTFSNLSATCANVQQDVGCKACEDLFAHAIEILGKGNTSAQTSCGTALLVSLTSLNISQLQWRYALDSCLEVELQLAQFIPATPGENKSTSEVTIILAAILCVVVGLLLLRLAVHRIHGREKNPGPNDDENFQGNQTEHGEQPANEGTLYEFSARELDRATDGFNEKNFIGEGSAGRVYKGALPSGQLVAIKVIKNETKSDTFYKEIENLSRVRHPNLVTLIGYCQTADKNLLVYEYCSKGNLSYYLFGGGPPLTWSQRLNIALGSARGLMYLHMNPCGYIVHRDIKPTNILLTESYEAKVSDFGLSRFITLEESRVFTEVKGTAGYLDPEYVNQGTLTFSSDVYSFGVVLLQLISGRRPINIESTSPFSIIKMAKLVDEREAELSDFVDPRLEGAYSESSCLKVIDIAVQCTLEHGVYRPSMIEVRQCLEEAWVLGGSAGSNKATPLSEEKGAFYSD